MTTDLGTGRSRSVAGRRSLDAALLVVIGLIALSPLDVVFGAECWWIAAIAGLAVGLIVATASTVWRLSAWPTALLAFLGYLVIGTPIAQADRAVAGVLPTPDAVRALVTGLVEVWRDMVTVATPLVSAEFLLVPLVAGQVAALASALLLWRSPWPASAFLPVAALFAVGCAFGARDTPGTVVRGLLIVVLTTVWLRWRRRPRGRVNWGRRIVAATAVLATALGVTWGYAAATDEDDRRVLRDHVEPFFDPTEFASPLSAFRAYRVDGEDVVQLRVDGVSGGRSASGRDLDPRIQIAVMDYFDGNVWNVAGGAGAVSDSGRFDVFEGRPGGEAAVEVTLEAYVSVWVPTVGDYRRIEAPASWDRGRLMANAATGTMAYRDTAQPGDVYVVHTVVDEFVDRATVLRADAGPSAVPAPARQLDSLQDFADAAIRDAAATTAGAQALALEEAFRQGFFSDGTGASSAASGHGLRRLMDLMESDVMVGNEEQYASAMALAAQQRGLPARVVMGFKPRGDAAGFAGGEVRGEDVSAWVEIELEGLGWVPFDPTPDENRTQEERNLEPEPQPQPHVLQPPNIPGEPDHSTEEFSQGAGGPPGDLGSRILAFLRLIVKPLLGVLIVLAVPATILAAKALRRRRRRRATATVAQVSGAWREVLDVAHDFGARAPRGRSRAQAAAALDARFPDSGVGALAFEADRFVFGPGHPSRAQTRAYWEQAEQATGRIRSSASRWRRLRAAVSPASFELWARFRRSR